jgi:alpha-beta hydrolase superfamily lysophospholipase
MTRSITSADGTPLRADYYVGQEPARRRGVIVVVHGYCEHRGRYVHVAEHLVRHGYAVLVGDLRGHGESGGERGFIRRFGDYVDDVSALLAEAQRVYSAQPESGAKEGSGGAVAVSEPGGDAAQMPILLGHSMGGLVVLEYVLAHAGAVRAIALSSPFLGIKLRVPAWKRALGLAASLLHPTLRLPNGINPADVSHDPGICQAYASDPLITHEATARWFTETLSAQADVKMRAGRVRTPTLFLEAGDDRIVDSAASQAVFSRIGSSDKTLNVYPGLFHEIFNEAESDRQRVLTDLTTWLQDR